jgi:hypothetical protein
VSESGGEGFFTLTAWSPCSTRCVGGVGVRVCFLGGLRWLGGGARPPARPRAASRARAQLPRPAAHLSTPLQPTKPHPPHPNPPPHPHSKVRRPGRGVRPQHAGAPRRAQGVPRRRRRAGLRVPQELRDDGRRGRWEVRGRAAAGGKFAPGGKFCGGRLCSGCAAAGGARPGCRPAPPRARARAHTVAHSPARAGPPPRFAPAAPQATAAW